VKIVGYYTRGTPYEDEAALLAASLDRVGMPYDLHPTTTRGGWDANTAMKPVFLRWQRSMAMGPLVYVDVDAFVHADCAAYFDGLAARSFDFGAHWFAGPPKGHDWRLNCACLAGRPCDRDHRMLSGTLYLGDTSGCRRLLDRWIELNRREDAAVNGGGGQKNLWRTVVAMGDGLRVARMPGRYCYVWDKPRGYPLDEPCIIEHTIASRENRGTSAGRLRASRQRRLSELRALLKEVA
jgi:hypothetical protein